MKKVLGLFLVLAFVFSFAPTAYAAETSNDKLWDALSNPALSGDAKLEMSIQLNKPFLLIPNMEETANLLADSKLFVDMAFNMSEDGTAIKSKIDMTAELPAVVKEMLGVDLEMTIWMDYDMSEDGRMYMILTIPGEDVYYYYDMSMDEIDTIYSETPGMENISIGGMANMSEIKELSEKILESYKDNTIVTENDGVYNIVYTAEFLTELMSEAFATSYAMASEMMGHDEEYMSEYLDMLGQLRIFADEAIVTDITLDDDGVIKTEDSKINVQFNVYDMLDTFGLAKLDESITRDNSDIDFTLLVSAEYININTPVEIGFPELTEENSVNIIEAFTSTATSEFIYSDDDQITIVDLSGNVVEFDTEPFIADNQFYVPLKDALVAVGIDESGIYWSNGTIYIETEYTKVSFQPNDERLFVNGEEVATLYTTVKMGSNSRSYVTVEWMEALGIGEELQGNMSSDGILTGGVLLLYR